MKFLYIRNISVQSRFTEKVKSSQMTPKFKFHERKLILCVRRDRQSIIHFLQRALSLTGPGGQSRWGITFGGYLCAQEWKTTVYPCLEHLNIVVIGETACWQWLGGENLLEWNLIYTDSLRGNVDGSLSNWHGVFLMWRFPSAPILNTCW